MTLDAETILRSIEGGEDALEYADELNALIDSARDHASTMPLQMPLVFLMVYVAAIVTNYIDEEDTPWFFKDLGRMCADNNRKMAELEGNDDD